MSKKITEQQLENAIKVIDKWLEYKRFFKRIPGMSVGIVYKDKVIFNKGYGYENLRNKKKASATTLYRIASNSKTFTATAIMQLAEQGKLHLDDKVNKYLDWFESEKDKELDKITIRQLLSHSSGVNRDGNTPHWVDDNFPDLENIKAQVKNGVSTYPPLERFKYSNLGFTILGEIIKVVSGRSYEDYVKDAIIKPLGMSNTYPDMVDEAKEKLATGYGRDIPNKDREEFTFPNTHAMVSAAGFISNVTDLCKYLAGHFLDSGKLLSNDSKKEMQRVHWFRKDKDEHYGLGFKIWENEKMQLIGHGGGFQGYITRSAMDKDEKIGVVVLTNAIDGPALTLANGIFQIIKYFKEHDEDFKKPEKTLEMNKYEGLFSMRWGYIQIVEINGHLLGFSPSEDKPMESIYELEYIDNDEFKIRETDEFDIVGEKIKFEFDKEGKATKLLLGPNPTQIFTIPD